MEKQIKIPTGDGHVIYGTLNWLGRKPKALIIFVHGLTSSELDHHIFNASRFFPKRGFATLRFNLYDWRNRARKLRHTSLAVHARDTNTVVDHFRKRFEKIFLVGHSWGGPTIICSDTSKVDGIVLWEPTPDIKKTMMRYLKPVPRTNYYLMDWGIEYLVGKATYNELMHFPDCLGAIRKIKKPIKFILAGNGILVKGGRAYHRNANSPKALSVISGATHNFDEWGTEEHLFRETLSWVKRFSK